MTPTSLIFERLATLRASGVLVLRNPTQALTVPPEGAVIMLDYSSEGFDRALSTQTVATQSITLQCFIPSHQTKTLSQLEGDVAAILRGDRTLSNTVDQLFLFRKAAETLPGGDGINASALTVQVVWG